jgi:hypothetical protein
MSWTHRTLIVAAQDADLARALAAGIAPDTDTQGMWRTPLSATGQEPATHYVSAGLIQDAFAAIVGDTQATYAAAGGQAPLSAIEGLYSRATISDQPGLAVIEQAGLQFVEPA